MTLVVQRQRRWRDVVAAAPDLHLIRTVLLDGLRLVQSLQRTVVTFVQAPAALHRQPHQVHLVEHDPHGANGAFEDRGKDQVEIVALGLQQPAGFARFVATQIGQVHIHPAGEQIFQIPGALTVTNQYEFAGHESIRK